MDTNKETSQLVQEKPKNKLKELAKNLILFLVVLGVMFLLIEGVFRIIKPAGTVDRRRVIATMDERGYTIHRANVDEYLSSPETGQPVHMKTNQEGFIGNNYSIEKPANTVRLAIFGDSFTEGIQIDFEKTFAYLLEKNLNQKNQSLKYEVMNFAVGGTGTMESVLLYEYYAKKYQPDLAILFFFENDFENNQFYLGERGKIIAGAGNDPAWTEIPQSNANFKQDRQDWRAKLLRNSRFIQWIDRVVRTNPILFRLSTKIGLHHQGPLGEGEADIPTGQFIFQLPLQENYQEVFELTKDIINLFNQQAKRNKTKFALVYLPMAIQVDERLWQKTLAENPDLKNYQWDLQQPNNYLKRISQENQIPFLDFAAELIPYYQSHSADEFLYLHRDGHFNELGHQLVAQEVQKFIKEVLKQ